MDFEIYKNYRNNKNYAKKKKIVRPEYHKTVKCIFVMNEIQESNYLKIITDITAI